MSAGAANWLVSFWMFFKHSTNQNKESQSHVARCSYCDESELKSMLNACSQHWTDTNVALENHGLKHHNTQNLTKWPDTTMEHMYVCVYIYICMLPSPNLHIPHKKPYQKRTCRCFSITLPKVGKFKKKASAKQASAKSAVFVLHGVVFILALICFISLHSADHQA